MTDKSMPNRLEYAPLKGAAVKKTEALVKKIKVNNQMVLK